jgi:hypothetical protein
MFLLPCASAAAALLLAGPSSAGSYYSYRTDEGAYAFTDDVKAIPAAYRAEAKRHALRPLRAYERMTPSDARATSDYSKRLDERLAHLRGRNEPVRAESSPGTARGTASTIALQTGGENSPVLQISPAEGGGSSGPVIVETLAAKPAGGIVTHNNTVVRQGDQTLVIVRSRPREWNLSEDIHIESDLE